MSMIIIKRSSSAPSITSSLIDRTQTGRVVSTSTGCCEGRFPVRSSSSKTPNAQISELGVSPPLEFWDSGALYPISSSLSDGFIRKARQLSVRQASKSEPRRTLEDLTFPWTNREAWWMYPRPCATSSAIFRHEVQWRGFGLVDLEPTTKTSELKINQSSHNFN